MTQPIDVTGHWSYPVSPLIAGEVLVATQSNGTATSGGSAPVTVQALVPPVPPAFSGTPYHEGDGSVSGTGIAGATVTLLRNGISAGSAVVGGGGTWTQSVSPALVAGDTLTATQTTGSGTSVASAPTVALTLPPVPPPSGQTGSGIALETTVGAELILLETGDVLLHENDDRLVAEPRHDRLLFEFTLSPPSTLLLEIGDDLLHENNDRVLLDGAAYEGTTDTGLLLLENVGSTASGGVFNPRTNQSGIGRIGSRQPR